MRHALRSMPFGLTTAYHPRWPKLAVCRVVIVCRDFAIKQIALDEYRATCYAILVSDHLYAPHTHGACRAHGHLLIETTYCVLGFQAASLTRAFVIFSPLPTRNTRRLPWSFPVAQHDGSNSTGSRGLRQRQQTSSIQDHPVLLSAYTYPPERVLPENSTFLPVFCLEIIPWLVPLIPTE